MELTFTIVRTNNETKPWGYTTTTNGTTVGPRRMWKTHKSLRRDIDRLARLRANLGDSVTIIDEVAQ